MRRHQHGPRDGWHVDLPPYVVQTLARIQFRVCDPSETEPPTEGPMLLRPLAMSNAFGTVRCSGICSKLQGTYRPGLPILLHVRSRPGHRYPWRYRGAHVRGPCEDRPLAHPLLHRQEGLHHARLIRVCRHFKELDDLFAFALGCLMGFLDPRQGGARHGPLPDRPRR